MSDCVQIPFFPVYETIYLENKSDLAITFFEAKFSQNLYNFENRGTSSNACTLIIMLMATYCRNEEIIIDPPDVSLNPELIYLLAYSILDGNRIHNKLRDNGTLNFVNLTVPEGLKYLGGRTQDLTEWKSMIYMESMGQTLYGNIKANLGQWYKNNKSRKHELYIILIAEGRSVLFIVQTATVSLVDSHQHSEKNGAIIAVASREKFNILCLWYSSIFGKYYHTDPGLYELSFLYFK